MQAHYLNATTAPLDVRVTVTLSRVDLATVHDRAAVLFFSNLGIDVPAGASNAVATKSCTLPFAVNLVQATGHMHAHGRAFAATSGGTTLFSSSSYSDVTPALFAPPLALPAGSRRHLRLHLRQLRRHHPARLRRLRAHRRDVHLHGAVLPGPVRRLHLLID